MTSAQDFHSALFALVEEAAASWMPPAGETDDPYADWREVTPQQFRDYRAARDRELVAKFAELLSAEREELLRRMADSVHRAARNLMRPAGSRWGRKAARR